MPNPPRIKSSTKGASITKQGHTTSGDYGDNYQAKRKFGRTVRSIDPKS